MFVLTSKKKRKKKKKKKKQTPHTVKAQGGLQEIQGQCKAFGLVIVSLQKIVFPTIEALGILILKTYCLTN